MYGLTMSKTEMKMRQRIMLKFEKAGATSKKTAITVTEANLDPQEQYWFPYLIGGYSSSIKETEGSRYYK